MDEVALTRSRDKHPAAKVSVEARKVKSKVEKSDTTRRQQKMKEATHVKLSSAQDMRQRIENLAAKDLPDRAEKLAARENIDYGAAVRQIIAEDEAFHHLPGSGQAPDGGDGLAQIVAERMAADPEGYAND